MSQTETIMLFVLGFAFAGLVALFLGRLAWQIALRLGARRMQRQVPTTVAELQAERDRLRAEYAMMSRKLELRLDDVKMRMAEQLAEVSRNRNRIETLMAEVKKREETIAERDGEISGLNNKIAALEGTILGHSDNEKKLGDQMAVREAEIDKLSKTLVSLNQSLQDRDSKLAALGDEMPAAVRAANMGGGDPEVAQDRLKRRIAELTNLSEQISHQRETSSLAGGGLGADTLLVKPSGSTTISAIDTKQKLEEKIAEAEQENSVLQNEIKRLDEAWSEKLAQLQKSGKPREVTATKAAAAAAPKEDPRQIRGIANVISLAQRIRALQKDIGS
jgi:septal ring factor EnvC (AmiA/AmiB activator)